MFVHESVRAWIDRNYPRPRIDQEWLIDCSDWVIAQYNLDPTRNFEQFIQHVEAQLLQSNLSDSTVHGTGIDPSLVKQNSNEARPRPSNTRPPARPTNRPKVTSGPAPLLVEIKSITEIAHSAFSLLNTYQTRVDRADLGLARGDDVDPEVNQPDEDEGPIPRFPRGMLRFELSDGFTTFKAIEYRSFPQLVLGETPLGYKMILRSTPIRNGIVFLDPSNVTLKAHRTEDHDIHREQVFLSSLRRRLGRPEPPLQTPESQPQINAQELPHHPSVPSPPPDQDDMFMHIDPDILHAMTMEEIEGEETQTQQRIRAFPDPISAARSSDVKLRPMTKDKTVLNWNPTQASRLNTTTASSSLYSPNTKTSPYFASHICKTKVVPDIGLSPLSCTKQGMTIKPKSSNAAINQQVSTSGGPLAAKPAQQSGNRLSSPDLYDDLSFGIDADESFFEQVGIIEQVALGESSSSKNKGKSKSTEGEGAHPSDEPSKRTPSKSGLGTISRTLHLVSPLRAEPAARDKGTTLFTHSTHSTHSTQPHVPPPRRRPPRDPSLIVISSSEDEADPNDYGDSRPLPGDLARRLAHNKRRDNEEAEEVVDSEVIDISE